MDVRRPPAIDVVAPRIGPRLHRAEIVVARLIGQRAAAAAEIGIDRREIGVLLVPVATAGIGLPELHQRVRHAAPGLVQHAAMHHDPFADGIAVLGVVADQVVVERPDVVMTEHRTGDFRDRAVQRQQRIPRRAQHRRFVAGRMRGRVNGAVALEKAAIRERRGQRLGSIDAGRLMRGIEANGLGVHRHISLSRLFRGAREKHASVLPQNK